MTIDEIAALNREQDRLQSQFDELIGHDAYWHAAEGDGLPDEWREQVTQLVSSLRAHASEIESIAGQYRENCMNICIICTIDGCAHV